MLSKQHTEVDRREFDIGVIRRVDVDWVWEVFDVIWLNDATSFQNDVDIIRLDDAKSRRLLSTDVTLFNVDVTSFDVDMEVFDVI